MAATGLACASHPQPPPALERPGVALHVDHFAGAPLSRAMPATQPVRDEPDVRLTITAMEKPAWSIGDPVGSHAQLVSVARGSTPVLPEARLTDDVRLVLADGASAFERNLHAGNLGRTAAVGVLESVLVPGVASRFQVVQIKPRTDALSGQTAQRRFLLELGAGPQDHVQAALTVEDFVPEGGSTRQLFFQTEAVLLDPFQPGTPAAMLIVPFAISDTRGFALTVEIGRLFDAEQHAKLAAACQADAIAAAAAAKPLPTTLPATDQFAIQRALAALSRRPDDRAALVFLADQTDAHLCAKTAIVADGATLTRLAQTIVKQSPPLDRQQTGWMLDRATLDLLSSHLAAESLQPELAAVLTDYGGEAGRHAASIEEVLRGPNNRSAVEAGFVAENLIFLADSSPAARVRAFDWLTSHGQAPTGYDPLAPPRQRRAALENALAAAATQPAERGAP
ncbi:MAG TPA: hypothetical protein VK797_14820 [Tepidisphaeraceae bacterium]|nr:hypothetical protein [Tepidisphaeraceae bacterium]